MSGLIDNSLWKEKSDDDSVLGDNAMGVARGASFLMEEDPNKDSKKPKANGTIGEETTVAEASNLGPNPLGPNPFGLAPEELDLLGIKPFGDKPADLKAAEPVKQEKAVSEEVSAKETLGASARGSAVTPAKESVGAFAKESEQEPEGKKKTEKSSFGNFISVGENSMIIFGSAFFGSEVILDDLADEKEDNSAVVSGGDGVLGKGSALEDSFRQHNEDDKSSGENAKDADFGLSVAGLESVDDGSMDLMLYGESFDEEPLGLLAVGDDSGEEPLGLLGGGDDYDERPLEDGSNVKEQESNGAKKIDPLMELLLAGGNPFGDNAVKTVPDLSFGKEALKPKHYEPMKASGPKANIENAKVGNPLGDNPFGKEIAPDLSLGKKAEPSLAGKNR